MKLDTSSLRTPDDSFPPIKDRVVTLIRIANAGVTQAYSVSEKREMLRTFGKDDTLVAVWTGKWHSDVFRIPNELLIRWKQDIL